MTQVLSDASREFTRQEAGFAQLLKRPRHDKNLSDIALEFESSLIQKTLRGNLGWTSGRLVNVHDHGDGTYEG